MRRDAKEDGRGIRTDPGSEATPQLASSSSILAASLQLFGSCGLGSERFPVNLACRVRRARGGVLESLARQCGKASRGDLPGSRGIMDDELGDSVLLGALWMCSSAGVGEPSAGSEIGAFRTISKLSVPVRELPGFETQWVVVPLTAVDDHLGEVRCHASAVVEPHQETPWIWDSFICHRR